MRTKVLRAAAMLVALIVRSTEGAEGAAMGVSVKESGDTVRVEFDGQLFTEYRFDKVDRPFFFPVIGPTGENVTRSWPVTEGDENEQKDHPHHRGLWYTHGDVNGLDFWSEGKGPKIVHQKFTKLESGRESGTIESENRWVDKDGKLVCSDRRRHVFRQCGDVRMLDFEIVLIASHGRLVLGDTKEGSMAIRVRETMRVTGPIAKGHILNSEGVKDGDAWGRRAKWCVYYGPVKNQPVSIAVFDHPSNPRHPTWWHVRDYGLFGANPYGIAHFEKKPRGSGNLEIEEGKSVTFRYRFVFLKGEPQADRLEALFQSFATARE